MAFDTRLWKKRKITCPEQDSVRLLFRVRVSFFHSLPSRVGYGFNVGCFPFLNCFASCLLDIIFLPTAALENCMVCTGELIMSIRFLKHSPSLHKQMSAIGLYCYHVNRIHVLLLLCSHFEQLWMKSNCWAYMYWSWLLTTWQVWGHELNNTDRGSEGCLITC